MKQDNECLWLERVSSMLDGEVHADEEELIRRHTVRCATCRSLLEMNYVVIASAPNRRVISPLILDFPSESLVVRVLLGLAGVTLFLVGVMNFVRGSSGGENLHDLRHLAVWQASLGVSVFTLTIAFRFSLFIIVTSVSFIAFTTVTAFVDLLLGHRGPWADMTHLLESIVLALLLIAVVPQARWSKRLRRQVQPDNHDA
jgi:hypothetical protein